MDRKDHWERVYQSKPDDRLGWYKPQLQTSLTWIRDLNLDRNATIIDAGGGASTLVDDLLEDGHRSITVLDLSAAALSQTKSRLGDRAVSVSWVVGDITTAELPANHYDVWHDRAVFHFLTNNQQQQRYRDSLLAALKPGGHLVIAAFAPEAPPKCSGLPVQRYSLDLLVETLGDELELLRHHKEMHITPGGVEQMYLYCQFRRGV